VVFRLDTGLAAAATFAVLNAMWYEMVDGDTTPEKYRKES